MSSKVKLSEQARSVRFKFDKIEIYELSFVFVQILKSLLKRRHPDPSLSQSEMPDQVEDTEML